MRKLSANFMEDLKGGVLKGLLDRVKKDDTLMLSIRKDYINIYYRGGSILRVKETGKHQYEAVFDRGYAVDGLPPYAPDWKITHESDIKSCIRTFPTLKEYMDFYFHTHPKLEREFQQLVVRENNSSSISNASEYFITDIEFFDREIGARFDLTAIKWLANDRRAAKRCRPVFIEMKYGDGVYGGSSGMLKHLEDFKKFICDKQKYDQMLSIMESQFIQLDELGLIEYNRSKEMGRVSLPKLEKPEVVFLLANHNQRSKVLARFLTESAFDEVDQSNDFDLKFYVGSYAGYAMHSDNMLSLAQMRQLVEGRMSKLFSDE